MGEYFHGTAKMNAGKIVDTGLKPSTEGCLGPGFYFTDDINVAKAYGSNRANKGPSTPFFILVVELDLTNLKDMGTTLDKAGDWQQTHECAKRIHPPFPEPIKWPYTEICMKSMKKVKIVGAKMQLPLNNLEFPISSGSTYYVMCGRRFLDSHGEMLWTPPGDNDVGPVFTQIQWRLEHAGNDTYYLINVAREEFLDGNVSDECRFANKKQKRTEKVKLWVGAGGTNDKGIAPQFIRWKFEKSNGAANSYYLLNEGKQKWLDSNGMSLWRHVSGDLSNKGQFPQALCWKLVPA